MEGFYELLHSYTGINADTISKYFSIFLKIVVILITAKLIIYVSNRVIVNIFKLSPKLRMEERKTVTLTGILRSVIKYTVYIIMVISILEALEIPTQPLLATAGLGGLAIGFGAQSLVKDVFTGFFILFEDQYSVGDFVTINGITGTVEELGLRVTKIRSFKGEINIIPNGEVKIVTNLSRGNSVAVVEVGISYECDEEKAIMVLDEAANKYYNNNPDKVVEKPEVQGIISFGQSEVVIRTIIRTVPLMHWKVEREIRKEILEAFKANDIEIPYPRRVIIENKNHS